MLLLIDNYDSFTYNLLQYFLCLKAKVLVIKNDELDLAGIAKLQPNHIVLSPGPNAPKDAGISLDVIRHFYQLVPILGVCLGHQCLAEAFGGNIIAAPEIMHGKTSSIEHSGQRLFKGLPSPFTVMRYHSLAVERQSLPSCFRIDAMTKDTIMAISHREFPLFGLQFHPESILSEHGMALLQAFLDS